MASWCGLITFIYVCDQDVPMALKGQIDLRYLRWDLLRHLSASIAQPTTAFASGRGWGSSPYCGACARQNHAYDTAG
jgi:hypothetical protein